MIILLGTVDVAPDEREQYLADRQPHAEASRTDAGNISFSIAADSTLSGRVHFVELWASKADLDEHGAASNRRNLPASAVAALASEFWVYEAGEPTPL